MPIVYRQVIAANVRNSILSFLGLARAKRMQAGARGLPTINPNSRCALGLVLMMSLLVNSTPAAAQTVLNVTTEWHASLGFWLRANNLPLKLSRTLSMRQSSPPPQERQEIRDGKIDSLRIYPGDVSLKVGERVTLAAVAYDEEGNSIGGVQMKWSARDEGNKHLARLSPQGEFQPDTPGNYNVVVEAGGKRAQIIIKVVAGPRKSKDERPVTGKPISTRDTPGVAASQRVIRASDVKSAHSEKRTDTSVTPAAARNLGSPATVLPLPPEGGWGSENYWSADDPPNRRGDPPAAPLDNGSGSGNFQLSAPILGLPGRGIDVSLALTYNSRLWNKAGSQINYDIDRDWPAAGWALGFGKVVGIAGTTAAMIIDADGTRHGFNGIPTTYSYGQLFTAHTTDGTFIDYSTWRQANGWMTWAEVNLPNGSQIHYNCQGSGGVFPTQIIDANGNYITITYVNNTGPNIQTVTDTLGRVINFHYDANNLLTSITTPGLGGGTRTLVRLHYRQLALSYSFSGLTPVVSNSYPWVIDAIYYPGTSTGYWFGDSDSYSTYGMLAKVVEQRGMGFSAASLDDQGTVTQGQMSRKEVHNYPLFVGDTSGTQSSGLSDAPTYTAATESWTRDGVNADQAVTNYELHQNSNPRTVTITFPNGTKSTQTSYNAPGNYLDGLVYQDQMFDANNVLLQSSNVSWVQGAYDSPRSVRVEGVNERGLMTATEYSYGPSYNQVTEARNYDYGGVNLLTATHTTYQNGSNYTTARHIFNLPLTVETYAGDNLTRVSRTEYQYDGQTLTDAPGVIMHANNHNPYAPQYLVPGGCCNFDSYNQYCVEYCPDYYQSDYNPVTDYRGNVTQSTTYGDAVNLTSPISSTRRYDITGNVVVSSSACCEQTSFGYTDATQFAYPQTQTQGSASDAAAQLKTSATYDFNTGQVLSGTEENGLVTLTSYSAATLRPQTITLPSGAYTDYAYDDTAMSVTKTTYLAPSPADTGAIADQSIKLLNGRGQLRQTKALGTNGVWDFADTVYDNMGRVVQKSQPYRSGDTPQFSTSVYDALSRTISVQAPDGSTSLSFYNEAGRPDVASTTPGETTRVVDAWGRERWGRVDSQGRLVEIVEPNPGGSGSVASAGLVTTYSYDTQGNLTAAVKEAQTRFFKYDSLGRLLAEKLAETDATLNDAGQYVGAGTWSDVFTYDDRSNLTSRTDARGVKSIFSYGNDPLNRLQSVSYDTAADPNHNLATSDPNYYLKVLDAATVNYQYRTNGGGTQLVDITDPVSITTSGISTESFLYDTAGRVWATTVTLNSRVFYPLRTDYIFDTLDRVTDVLYPAEYGNGSASRRLVHHDFDVASRTMGLTVAGTSHASQIVYNAASQTTQLKVGPSGANQITENYGYSAQTGLLESQTLVRGGTALLDLSYDYAGANGKRSGQLTKILNNLNHNKDRGYSYDALGRLTQAKGGPSGALWTQNYAYDHYGNRTSVSATGSSARNQNTSSNSGDLFAGSAGASPAASGQSGSSTVALELPIGPKVVLPTEQLAARSQSALPETERADEARASGSSFHHSPRLASPPAVAPPLPVPPAFTDDPLVPGVTTIKSVHITELRTAVNQARSLGGLSAASWSEAVASGVTIKAAHIAELRSRLAEARAALSLSVATYTDPTLTAGSTAVKAVHITELRQRVTEALAGTAGCPAGQNLAIDQFVKNFYQAALNRQPIAVELQSWTDQLRQAYYQAQSQLLASAQYMGRQIFKSAEYVNRNRVEHDYVYDLYKAYLQREPDQSGWDYWTTQVPPNGRDNVREAFALSSEFAVKVGSICAAGAAGSSPIPLDGLANVSYNAASNRINTAGFQYDKAGNQTRIVRADGSAQKFQYDAANRLAIVRDDYGYVITSYTYGDRKERLIAEQGGLRTYYLSESTVPIAEYTESGSSTIPAWSRSYIYLGTRLLSTLEPNGSGGDRVQHHHPDRLGTRVVSDPQAGTSFEQVALPFGAALNGESTGATSRRFTSYDRSAATGLDYAVNRHFDSQQGRFTQVDPVGMKSVELANPQSLNLYAYCTNDPVNHTDPAGLGFFSWLAKLFHKIGHFLSAVGNAVARVLNNRWVRIGVLILGFLVPFLGPIAKAIQLALKIYNGIADVVGQMQLYGMLLQGKFKQLGMAMLNGFIGSFIATIENGILGELQNYIGKVTLNGQDYIDWRKFTFKDFFNGMWHGLKTGLKDAANQLLRYRHDPGKSKSFWTKLKDALVPGYGHWCGPGIGQGAGESRVGVNGVDEKACRPHDGRYNTPGYSRLSADFELFGNLLTHFPGIQISDLAFGSGPSIGTSYKFGALPLFGAILPGFRFILGPH
jgi:RHS repeat-associated protein